MSRIAETFATLRAEKKSAFISFVMGGAPDAATSLEVMKGLPAAGADIIELGMPFSDPMADGPAIQAAGMLALQNGATLRTILEQVRAFRAENHSTPVVLMGYFNPIFYYGVEQFCSDAEDAGVDGLIIVDLPPEEEQELVPFLGGIDFIRLITPVTPDDRIARIVEHASGFLYYVSVTGVTGVHSAQQYSLEDAVLRIRQHTDMPLAIGFGIKSPQQVRDISAIQGVDAAVVGSAIVQKLSSSNSASETLAFVKELASGR